jgi:hypothetical protein
VFAVTYSFSILPWLGPVLLSLLNATIAGVITELAKRAIIERTERRNRLLKTLDPRIKLLLGSLSEVSENVKEYLEEVVKQQKNRSIYTSDYWISKICTPLVGIGTFIDQLDDRGEIAQLSKLDKKASKSLKEFIDKNKKFCFVNILLDASENDLKQFINDMDALEQRLVKVIVK